ncbi:hypothetical protein GCM10027416_22280 [Okibacterium endophyticum]
MPLDPFFSERVKTHRRYLIGQMVDRFTEKLPWARQPAKKERAKATAEVAATEVERSALGGLPSTPPLTKPTRPKPTRPKPARATSSRAKSSPKAARARYRKSALAWDVTELATVGVPAPKVHTVDETVPVDGHPDVRIRVYYPNGSPDADDRLAACLSFFGGAFRIGGIDYPTTDAGFRHRAADSGVAIVAVDYALAPEHRYPTQVEQAHAALTWLFTHAESLSIDASRIAVSGISAGANIAAALTLMNRDRQRLPIRFQILEVPVVDLTGRHIDLRATRAMGIPSFFAIRELRSVARTYLGDRSLAREPLASPLLASSHAGLPPAYLLTAEFDPLRGDGAAYAAALRADGVEASAVQYLGVTHDTPIFTGVLPAARRWNHEVASLLRGLDD